MFCVHVVYTKLGIFAMLVERLGLVIRNCMLFFSGIGVFIVLGFFFGRFVVFIAGFMSYLYPSHNHITVCHCEILFILPHFHLDYLLL